MLPSPTSARNVSGRMLHNWNELHVRLLDLETVTHSRIITKHNAEPMHMNQNMELPLPVLAH